MPERTSHQDYAVSCRAKGVAIAAGILDGSIPVMDGCRSLDRLAPEVDIPADDPDFGAFSVIHSETDNLPVGQMREHWAPAALASLETETRAAARWAEPLAIPAGR